MKPLDCITVGLSLTESDPHLLSYAAMLAGMGIGKTFRFVHVLATPRPSPGGVDHDELRQQMQSSVAQHFGEVGKQVQVACDVREGVRLDQLLADIEQHPSDVVVVGQQTERQGWQSLATRLAMISPTSVWTVPNQAHCQLRRILAPTDFSSHSADSVCLATSLAKQAGLSECTALHVYFDSTTIRGDETIDEERGHEADAFEQFLSPLELHDVHVTPIIEEESNVTAAILRIAVKRQSDLIVMNTRGRSRAASILLGSETSRTMIESHIPVLAVKHRGAFLNLYQALQDPKIWTQPEPQAN